MNKLSYGLILSLFVMFTSASAEVTSESIVNIFQRLETLEKKARELHGENEVLRHQIGELKKAQKEGFLNVDERIEGLSGSKADNKDATKPAVENDKDEKIKIIDYSAEKKSDSAEEAPKKEQKSEEAAKKPDPAKEPEKVTKAEDDKKDAEKTKESSSAKKVRAPSAYEKETYQVAFNLMKKSPSAATTAFKEYIKMQPESPLAANSQYWIGEIMYSHNNYKGAVQEFIKVLQNYKYSDKAPDAAIKLGYSFYALKNWAYARRTFDDVLKYFPENKNAVTLATKRLEKMTAAGH